MSLFRFLAAVCALMGALLFILGIYAAGPDTPTPLRPPTLVASGFFICLFGGGFWEWAHQVIERLGG